MSRERAIQLVSGCRVERPLARLLAFCRGEYDYYDAIPSRDPNRVEPLDVIVTVAMNPGPSLDKASKIRCVHQEIAQRCDPILPSIPEEANLLDLEAWREPLRELLHEACQVKGVLVAIATKVLHRKRRFLIPMLDRVILTHYLGVNSPSFRACTESKPKAGEGNGGRRGSPA